MTEEVPKTSPLLKFIVIFMGVLIIILLPVMVWKMVDLAQQKDARLKKEAAQKEPTLISEQGPSGAFAFEVTLESGEVIVEISAAANGIWYRIGRDGKTSRMIYKDYAGKTIGRIEVKREYEDAMPAN